MQFYILFWYSSHKISIYKKYILKAFTDIVRQPKLITI